MSIDKFSEIISSVNTPLALAALSILIIGSILYSTAQGHERPTLTKYGLGLAGLFGVLAMSGFFFENYSNSIFLIQGIVVNEENKPIDSALIDMSAAGRTVSGEDGKFKIPVSRNSSQESYSISARKAGYDAPAATIIPGPIPPFQQLILKEKKFSIDDIEINNQANVSIYIGVPEFFMNLSIQNKTNSIKSITSIILKLKAPTGNEYSIYGTQLMEPPMFSRPFSPINLQPSQDVSYQVAFSDPSVIQTAMATADRSGLLSPYGCNIEEDETNGQNRDLEGLFQRNFIWEPGTWKAAVTLALARGSITKSMSFDLTLRDVELMRNMKDAYKRCLGLLYANHYVSDGSMKSAIFVTLY